MASKGEPRPGGRSARVQASVHRAAQRMLSRGDRGAITIPAVAAEAGVTPSTIYRRWGCLQELLADLALRQLRPDTEPLDTGDAETDLRAWIEQYADEMSSDPGRELMRDVLATRGGAGRSCDFTKQQIEIIARRARMRGEAFPDLDAVIDGVVSPIVYRILFDRPASPEHVRDLVSDLMRRATVRATAQPTHGD